MGFLEGSGVPVLYIGRTVPKGLNQTVGSICHTPVKVFL
jgi:hypothetical protein